MNILLSYPRSGNTWIRYCIEFLSKKPTIGYTSNNAGRFDRQPLGSFNNDMGVDVHSDFILYKRHMVGEGYGKLTHTPDWSPTDKLILVIRDYKEVIVRHNGGGTNLKKLKESCSSHIVSKNYTQLIEYFDGFEGDKILIYYEDLLTDLENTLSKIINFLGVDDGFLKDFIQNISEHKKKSLSIYGDSKTKGNSTKSHSNKLTREQKISWDNWIKENFTDLSDKYLKRYYEEEN